MRGTPPASTTPTPQSGVEDGRARTITSSASKLKPNLCLRCSEPARDGSKYCSHDCGMEFHKERLSQSLAEEEAKSRRAKYDQRCAVVWREIEQDIANHSLRSVAEADDAKIFLELDAQKEQARRDIAILEKSLLDLDAIVARAASQPFIANDGPAMKTAHLDCPYCGVQPSHASLALHLPGCYLKFESGVPHYGSQPRAASDVHGFIYCDQQVDKGQYCKKLKASCALHSGVVPPKPHASRADRAKVSQYAETSCGAPTEDDPTGFCRLVKKDCLRHFNWDATARQQLVLQKLVLEQQLEAHGFDVEVIKERMVCRRLCRGLRGTAKTIATKAAHVFEAAHPELKNYSNIIPIDRPLQPQFSKINTQDVPTLVKEQNSLSASSMDTS